MDTGGITFTGFGEPENPAGSSLHLRHPSIQVPPPPPPPPYDEALDIEILTVADQVGGERENEERTKRERTKRERSENGERTERERKKNK